MMRAAMAVFGLCLFLVGPAAADETLGRISFPTSGSAGAQPHFERGVLLLHSFEFEDAAEAFREAQRLDPDFALAYWGEAMTYTHILWDERDVAAARAALARLAPTPEARAAKAPTAREKGYLAAVEVLYAGDPDANPAATLTAYELAMRRLSAEFPDDDEARAFHAVSILATNLDNRRFDVDARAAALVEDVYEHNRDHPGALHYMIHAYDSPVLAPLGLRPARRYGDIASGAAHALHMTSHIFVALGMWEESAQANEASWAASAARLQRKGLGIDANGFHAYLWLAYTYLQQGRFDDARRVVEHTGELAAQSGSRRTAYHYASARAYYIVESERWTDLPRALDPSLQPPPARASELFAEGLAAVKTGRVEDAEERLRDLHALSTETAAGEAHHGAGGSTISLGDRQGIAISARQLEGLIAYAQGRRDEAVSLLEEAAKDQDEQSYQYGPPFPLKPSRELLGETLLALGRPAEAQVQFTLALERAPRRAHSLEGLAESAELAGDRATAAEARRVLQEIQPAAPTSSRRD
jgi:tetratricopeptide (TPR) repeat protein